MVKRQLPRPAELLELMQFKKPDLDARRRRLQGALTIEDLRLIAKRRTPKAAFDYTDGAAEGELSVGQLQDRVGLGQSALSQHLAKLREEGLVATRKESQTVFYSVCDPKAQQVLALLHDLFCPELGASNSSRS